MSLYTLIINIKILWRQQFFILYLIHLLIGFLILPLAQLSLSSIVTELSSFLFVLRLCFSQLDPQSLQGKDWQRTVIPMNGVSLHHTTLTCPICTYLSYGRITIST